MKGFEIFFETIKHQIHSKRDVIVSMVHFMLIAENDFVCVGIGEEFPEDSTSNDASELLPTDWNQKSDLYTLLYRSRKPDQLKLLLKCIVAGNIFIASAVPLNSSNTVHSISLKPEEFITDEWNGSYSKAFVNGSTERLANLLRTEMLHKIRDTEKKKLEKEEEAKKKQTSSLLEESNPIQVPPLRHPHFGNPNPTPDYPFEPFGPRVGGADLDPLGRGVGGGMLFDPFRNPRGRHGPGPGPIFPYLPRGAVPPGARFDPFGPPGTGGRFARPDPDELPPPGYDDMFM